MMVLVFTLGVVTGFGTAIGIGLWINWHKTKRTKLGLQFLDMADRVRENRWEK